MFLMKQPLRTMRQWLFGAGSGQAMPEYALTLALITLACIGAVTYFGQSFSDFFQTTANYIIKVTSRY